MKTINEIDYGCSPQAMGTTGLIKYVRGHFWPLVIESTCFAARHDLACSIILKRNGEKSLVAFKKAVQS